MPISGDFYLFDDDNIEGASNMRRVYARTTSRMPMHRSTSDVQRAPVLRSAASFEPIKGGMWGSARSEPSGSSRRSTAFLLHVRGS